VGDLTRRELAQKMGYVEQQRQGSRTTVFDAVLMGRKPYIRWEATRRDLAIVDQILTRLELSAFALRFLDELSGGELQKVTIARALAQQPKVLLMDEPTSSLDLKNQLEVLALTREICQSGEISVVAAMHDLNLALRFADRFILLKDGEVFIAGGKEIITAETLHTVYGVSVAVESFNDNKVIIPLV
jgi:iron complex transport system ATP-binding protein